jgi:hypothetical protein
LLALTAIAVAAYLVLFEEALYAREAEFIRSDYVAAGGSIVPMVGAPAGRHGANLRPNPIRAG